LELREKLNELHRNLHEREMNVLLQEIDSLFDSWKGKEITGLDLHAELRAYQAKQFKDLYHLYNVNSFADINAARCLIEGVISLDEVDKDLHELILSKKKFVEKHDG